MSKSKWVRVGSVRRFDHVTPDKVQALKLLEEAAEVFGAWQEWDRYHSAHAVFDGPKAECAKAMKACIVDECADLIQATLNLVSALGVEDFRPYLKECERRNRERGRITDGKAVDE